MKAKCLMWWVGKKNTFCSSQCSIDIKVYSQCWFMIKKDNKFITSQIIYFFALKQTLKQPKKFRDIALKNITKNCYGLMPENVVFSLTQSNKP